MSDDTSATNGSPSAAAAPEGWYDDPVGRFEKRYFDGHEWTEHVANAGVAGVDPLEADPSPTDSDAGTGAPTEQPGVLADTAPGSPSVVVQRSRRSPFTPPTPSDTVPPGITVARNWAAARAPQREGGLTRNRVIAGDLPAWSPLPPGELQVDRSGGRAS